MYDAFVWEDNHSRSACQIPIVICIRIGILSTFANTCCESYLEVPLSHMLEYDNICKSRVYHHNHCTIMARREYMICFLGRSGLHLHFNNNNVALTNIFYVLMKKISLETFA